MNLREKVMQMNDKTKIWAKQRNKTYLDDAGWTVLRLFYNFFCNSNKEETILCSHDGMMHSEINKKTSMWCVKAFREGENTSRHQWIIMLDHVCLTAASSAPRGSWRPILVPLFTELWV